MQARNRCSATSLKIYGPICGNCGYNGKASGKVGSCSRPAGRFSQFQSDDLLVQQNIFQQEKALETDTARLVEQITTTSPDDQLNCVMDFATKWTANVSVEYDGFSYHMDLLKAETDATPSPDGKVEVTIIATTTEDGLKISLAENPLGGADFFTVEQGFADGAGSITAVVSRQHIEDAVSAVLMILPFTAILCMVISVLFALAYSRMFTRPIEQISAATEQMRELEPDAHYHYQRFASKRRLSIFLRQAENLQDRQPIS